MICLKHQQQYSEGEYCVYCGSPYEITISTTSTMITIGDILAGFDEERAKRKERARKAGRASAEKRKLSKLNNQDGK